MKKVGLLAILLATLVVVVVKADVPQMLVIDAQLEVNEIPPECSATAIGTVQTYIKAYYLHEDPNNPGQRFVYTGPIRTLKNESHTIMYDWPPVYIEWYARPWGQLVQSQEGFTLQKSCGEMPDPDPNTPVENPTWMPECDAVVDGSVEAYLVAYYLHEDPDNPGQRYTYTSETITAEDEPIEINYQGFPVAIEWFYRPYGMLASNGSFVLAKVCGEIPSGVPGDDLPLVTAEMLEHWREHTAMVELN